MIVENRKSNQLLLLRVCRFYLIGVVVATLRLSWDQPPKQ